MTPIPITAELLEEQKAWSAAIAQMEQDIADALKQNELDRMHGPRLGPGRIEYAHIMEPVWRHERRVAHLRRELLDVGMAPGRYRRRGAA